MTMPVGLLKFTRLAAPCAMLLAASMAHAAISKDQVAVTFGNTVESVYPDGRSQKVWMQPDGSWTGASRRGHPIAGKWNLSGDKICLKQTSPAMPVSFCTPFPTDAHVGGSWPSKDALGTAIQLQIVKGVVEVPPPTN